MNPPACIAIFGAGFGALSTVREIFQRNAKVVITLITPRAGLNYLPGIIWIPFGLRTRDQWTVPLANLFKRMNVQHIAAEVTGPRAGGGVVILPPSHLLHWVARLFEGNYLRKCI